MTVPTTAIRTEALAKRYGERQALHGLDLEVQPGEIFGFLGPNGAGKTTTIRLLLDLILLLAALAALCAAVAVWSFNRRDLAR